MGKKSTLTAEQRCQLVLRLLSKEEPGLQIAHDLLVRAHVERDHVPQRLT